MAIDKTTHSFGTILKTGTWSAATPETIPSMTAFGQATNIQIPESKTTAINATRLNQTNKYKRKRPGLVDPGVLTFDGHFDKTDFATLKAYEEAGTEFWIQVCIPEPDDATHLSTWSAHGFLGSLGVPVEEDDGIKCSVGFEVNGKPQFTAYS
ncbi:MAG TPA: hypothetical protein VEA69_21210 [Tepidisphaeraceae bacterium]|nr:hypothetical protein [Tepidisphaeraceae bacterium]